MGYTCRLQQLQKSLLRRRRHCANKIYIHAKIKKWIFSCYKKYGAMMHDDLTKKVLNDLIAAL